MHKREEMMSITLHSTSILDAIYRQDEAALVLMQFNEAKRMDFLMTPTNQAVPEEFHKITQMKYLTHPEGFVVELSTKHGLTQAFCGKQIPLHWPKKLYDYELNSTDAARVMEAFKAICAHEIFERDLFVTNDPDILSKKSWIEKRFDVKIVSPLEALERMDLFSKKNETYFYVNPHSYYDKLGYYWFQTKDLLPAFQEVWSIAVFGQKVVPNATEILSHLQSFSSRFENLLAAREKIGNEFFKTPNNLTAWRCFIT